MQLVAVQEDAARRRLAGAAGLFGLAIVAVVAVSHAPLEYIRALTRPAGPHHAPPLTLHVPCASAVPPSVLHSTYNLLCVPCASDDGACLRDSSLDSLALAAKDVRSPYALDGLAVRVVLYGRSWPAGDWLSSPMLAALSEAHPVRVTVERRDALGAPGGAEETYAALRSDVPAEADTLVLAIVHAPNHSFDAHWAPGWGGMCVVGAYAEAPRCVATALDAPLRALTNAGDLSGNTLYAALALSAIAERYKAAVALIESVRKRLALPSLQAPVSGRVYGSLRLSERALDNLRAATSLAEASAASFGAHAHASAAARDTSHVPEQGVSREQALGVLVPLLMPLLLPIAVALLSVRSDKL